MNYIILAFERSLEEKSGPKRRWQMVISYLRRVKYARLCSVDF